SRGVASRCRDADEPELDGAHHGPGGGMDLELAIGALDVARHRVLRYPERVAHLRIGAASRQKPQDIGLTPGEAYRLLHASPSRSCSSRRWHRRFGGAL